MADSETIITPRLTIEPFGPGHISARYLGWLNDPEVVRFSRQRHRRHTVDSCRAYLASFTGTPNYFWAIRLTEDGLHIGNVTAHVDPANGVADVGILIGERDRWGRGLGLEAFTAVIDYLFGLGSIRKITAGTMATNLGMLAVMRKAGLVEDGRRVRQLVGPEGEVDLVHGAVFRERWPAGSAGRGPRKSVPGRGE